jgi:hypothetical protein
LGQKRLLASIKYFKSLDFKHAAKSLATMSARSLMEGTMLVSLRGDRF